LFGKAFAGAEPAVAIAVATALVHMAAAPAASRLTILSLKMIGFINGIWAVAVIAMGPVLIPRSAAVFATAILLANHLVSAVLVLVCLWKKDSLPRGLVAISMPMMAGSVLFAVLGWLRFARPDLRGPMSLGIFAVTLLLIAITFRAGRAAGFLPPLAKCRDMAWSALCELRIRRVPC
jgi:hypothetical protein